MKISHQILNYYLEMKKSIFIILQVIHQVDVVIYIRIIYLLVILYSIIQSVELILDIQSNYNNFIYLYSQKVLLHSLSQLKTLPTNTLIYPGHGKPTILQDELLNNPYLKENDKNTNT